MEMEELVLRIGESSRVLLPEPESSTPIAESNNSITNVRPVIIGEWEKGDLLGTGSFGSVYEGISHQQDKEDTDLQDLVMSFSGLEEKVLEQYTFAKQIAQLSRCEHENIVTYYGTQRDESTLYIFLELVTTENSLLNLYHQYTLSDSRVSAYTRQILHGLKYLHDQHVVHRDIKCANVLVHASGSVKLADFGLVKALNLNNARFKGTANWMPPEVVKGNGQGYGLPADIWSLGCTVLEMLTGKIPFSDFECMLALFLIGKGQPPAVPASLSECAQDFILQCLKANPNDRPTATELLDHPFVRITLP